MYVFVLYETDRLLFTLQPLKQSIECKLAAQCSNSVIKQEINAGAVAERLKATVLKTVLPFRVTGVRIPTATVRRGVLYLQSIELQFDRKS